MKPPITVAALRRLAATSHPTYNQMMQWAAYIEHLERGLGKWKRMAVRTQPPNTQAVAKLQEDIEALQTQIADMTAEHTEKIAELKEESEDTSSLLTQLCDALVAYTDRVGYAPHELFPLTSQLHGYPTFVQGRHLAVREPHTQPVEDTSWQEIVVPTQPQTSKPPNRSQVKKSKKPSSNVPSGKPLGTKPLTGSPSAPLKPPPKPKKPQPR